MSSVVRPCALSLVWFLSLSAVAISKPDPLDRSADDVSVTRSSRPQPDEDAAVPRLVKFSGQLPLARAQNGTRLVTFSLYSQQEGGDALWSETQVVNLDATGHYTVMLGATILQGIPAEAFSSGEAR